MLSYSSGLNQGLDTIYVLLEEHDDRHFIEESKCNVRKSPHRSASATSYWQCQVTKTRPHLIQNIY